jgi:outer membrane protein OmpA-like peptidoglycan-associated protein
MSSFQKLWCGPFALLVLWGSLAPLAEAQLWKRVRNRVQTEAEQRAETRAVEAARRTLDLADNAIVCLMGDEACIREARQQGQEPVVVNEKGEPVSGYPPAKTAGSDDQPGKGVWANYDFVPGERLLFAHDFEGTRTGNFPSRLTPLGGTLEVVELDGNKVLRVGEGTSERGPGGNGCFTLPLPQTLPERYTVEFRLRTSDPLRRASISLFSDASDNTPDPRCKYPPNPHIYVEKDGAGLQLPGGYNAGKAGVNRALPADTWVDVRIAVDGPYWKMYVNEERVANLPRYDFPRAAALHFFLNVYRYGLFIDDLRIAEGGPRALYDDLLSAGFVSTTAIRFDTGSAVLKPESTGILHQVLTMLNEHADLRLRVEGHTDSQGSEDANQTLSERRAAAVVAWLREQGIAAARLEAVGYGEQQPVADNITTEGMAQNRRVVFRRP